MSNINIKSMFDQIKDSLNSDKRDTGGNSLYKEILKFTPGNTYQLRLVPSVVSPKDTIFHYYNHGWISNATGKYVTALCPTTFGESCPIDAYYLKTYRTGTQSEKENSKVLSRKEGWMVNVYVVSDPDNPENEGKVKILRYGKEIAKVIESALEGDDADEFGVERVFDVVNGSTLRVKCEHRSGKDRGGKQMVTYASSKFLSPSELDITEEQLQTIYDSAHDLKSVNKQTTPAEMQRLLDEHFFNLTTGSPEDNGDSEEEYREIVSDSASTIKKTSTTIERTLEKSSDAGLNETDETTDEALKKLLAEL